MEIKIPLTIASNIFEVVSHNRVITAGGIKYLLEQCVLEIAFNKWKQGVINLSVSGKE